ncbi:diguanylate cyclase [Marinomonas ushuaiensis DSM 15871]|uniref:diguanylate cyclase n=1 Tax=Marinomonas ushuaiensis DSM 15871 TaxID=1122207 RepID=X7EAK8_9GAMM|nr:GGDEF domain-containing protein [Marinomonas ushuaiensis]ETX12251.1 diguanylate cyclase [Marinomonas ushuaiensis DSM 15871]
MIAFLENSLGIKSTDPRFRFRIFLFSVLLMFIPAFAFFSYYNYAVAFYPPLLVLQLICLLLSLVAGYFLVVKKRPKITAAILQTVITVDTLLVIFDGGNEEFVLAFAFLTPVIGVFILGGRLGGILSVINFACVFYFCLTHMDTWEPAPFLSIDLIHFTTIYVLILVVSIFYDSSRRRSYEMMEEANHQLKELATTDALTKLRNRRYIEDQLLNSNHSQYIAMIDVDDFKVVNDTYGHSEGDKVLLELGAILKKSIGKNDIVGRWGGEEFVLIFEHYDLDLVKENLALLNENVATHNFNLERKITVSIGLSDHQACNNRDSLRKVDQALYEAKAGGKNRFCIASGLS